MKHMTFLILLAVAVVSCSPTTEITGSWRSNNTALNADNINTILVTALTGRTTARQQVENDLAAALEKQGFRTMKSIDVLPPTFTDGETPDREQLLARINGSGADAIMTVALIDEDTESRYVPGSAGYAPMPRFGYYGTFWGYYNTWYPMLHSPGYYEEDKVYFIETNLYDTRTEELLWSAQSESYNPSSLTNFANAFSEAIVKRLERDGFTPDGNAEGIAREPEQNQEQ